jgi:hypothetical protein
MADAVNGAAGGAPRVRVAVVVGLSHSGSTILDLTLGSHPAMVGAGEILNTWRTWLPHVLDGGELICSCGQEIRQCALWGAVIGHMAGTPRSELSAAGWYRAVIERFRTLYPTGTVLVDSSKRLKSIDLLREIPEVDLRVLLLARDVRGWMASASDREANRRRRRHERLDADGARSRSLSRTLADRLWGTPFGLARLWRTTYENLVKGLEGRNLPVHVVSYEQLCLQPEASLASICEFLELESPSGGLSPEVSDSHIVSGNKIRLREDRRNRITYDVRWLQRLNWVLPYLLMPGVRELNQRMVWGAQTQEQKGQTPR